MANKLQLPARQQKPRNKGLTAITDVGLPTKELEHILEDYHSFLDIAKFGIGSAYITPNLEEKLGLYRSYDIIPYFGGTLFEKAYYQNNLDEYLRFLDKHDVTCLEISTGTIQIPLEKRIKLVERLKGNFMVVGEVGDKDQDAIMAPSLWIEELQGLLDAGCTYVITEGRGSGTAGIYRPSGEIRSGLITDLIKNVDANKVIFEAPSPKSQMFFINLLGPNVNLGNVSARDLLLLEGQRNGLRNETFFLEEQWK